MRNSIATAALIFAAALLPFAAYAEDCSESYGLRLARSSVSEWAAWCDRCGGEVITTSGSPYCRPGAKWGQNAASGDNPYTFIPTGKIEIDAPLTFLSVFLNEMDKDSKQRTARAKAEREQQVYLRVLEAKRKAAEEARQRELSYSRLSGQIKGMENSGEFRLKGMGEAETLRIKGDTLFNKTGNPDGEFKAETDLKLKTDEPVQVSSVVGTAVKDAKPLTLNEKYQKLEDDIRDAEERLFRLKKAKEDAKRLKNLAEEKLKEANSGKQPALKQTDGNANINKPKEDIDDTKLQEAEKLLRETLDIDKMMDEEIKKAETDVSNKKKEKDEVKKALDKQEKQDKGDGKSKGG